MYYVKGIGDGKASCVWSTLLRQNTNGKDWDTYTSDRGGRKVKFLTNVYSEKIYPTLKIDKNKTKIIVETMIERNRDSKGFGLISDKAAMGLHIVSPSTVLDGSWSHMFHSVVIFTPKQGLFTETTPS